MAISAGIAGAVGAVASAGSSLVKGLGSGDTQSQADDSGQQATALAQQAASLWEGMPTPTFDKTPLQQQTWLQDYQPIGYDPYIGQMSQMSDDIGSLTAEQQALAQQQALARGGLQPADMLALEEIRQQQAGAATSANQAATAALQARGLAGSGAEYASQLAGNQNAANTASNLYSNAMQAAMNRQLQAINQAGTTAGNIRQQSDSISNQMANIANNFNSNVQQLRTNAAINSANISNQAQQANLTGRQTTANNNAATANQNLQYQNKLLQDAFGNTTTVAQGETNALNRQQALASANQAALSQQALGQQQSTTAGLNGLTGVANSLAGPNAGGSGGSFLGQLFGGNNNGSNATDSTYYNNGTAYTSSSDPNQNWQV